MRNNGLCPCHRCLVKKTQLSHLGAPTDIERSNSIRNEAENRKVVSDVRKLIYSNLYAVDSSKVEDLLKSQSLVPVHVRGVLFDDSNTF